MIISMAAQELSWEDILIAYSTLPGYVANRDCTKGTWFVQSLCKVFMEHAHNTNLRDMLDLVALDLKQNFTSETGTKQSFNYDVRHFYKKLYFNPGLQVNFDIKVLINHVLRGVGGCSTVSEFRINLFYCFLIKLPRYWTEVLDITLGMEELSVHERGFKILCNYAKLAEKI